MTIQEARDKVAKQHGLESWFDIDVYSRANEMGNEAAQLYGDSQYNQALTDIEGIINSESDAVSLLRKSVLLKELKRLKR